MHPTLRLRSSLPRTISQTLKLPISSSASLPNTTIHGWVSSIRAKKKIAFVEVRDGTSSRPVQVVVKGAKEEDGLRSIVDTLTKGTSVKVVGELVPSPAAGQPTELRAGHLEVLGPCDESYPLVALDHGGINERPINWLRDHAHLRMRETEGQAMVKFRDLMVREWRKYFEDKDYVHINTPIITSSDCEGAGEIFQVTSPTAKPNDPFFPPPGGNLTVSSQLHLELYLPSHPLVYTLSPAFRAEASNSHRHLSEFWMLEVEAAFITSVHQVMDIAEEGVRGVLGGLKKRMVEADAEDAGRKDSGGIGAFWRKAEVRERVEGAIGAEGWMRMSYSEAVELLQKVQKEAEERSSGNLTAETVTASSSTSSPDPSSLPPISAPFEYPPIHGQSLKSEHEKYLAGSYAKRPIFVYDYPADLKPFYMLPTLSSSKTSPSSTSSPPEPTVACFDLLVPELGELAGGSLREHRLEPLLESIKRRQMKLEPLEWFLDTRRYGSVPHGGFGLGFERMLSWVTATHDVRDVIGFPRWKGNCRY